MKENNMINKPEYKKFVTDDNSVTYHTSEFDETYHSSTGASLEAYYKFIVPSKLKERSKDKRLNILDIPFGLGYNTLSALDVSKNLFVTAIECDINPVGFLLKEENIKSEWKEILLSLIEKGEYRKDNLLINLITEDGRLSVKKLDILYDIIFLDPFSPAKNPELWSLDFFRLLYKVLDNNGVIVTYSSAMPVISAFKKAGFYTGKTPAVGRKAGGLIVSKNKDLIDIPLSSEEEYFITKTAGKIVYRDPKLTWDRNKIISYREKTRQRAFKLNILESVRSAKKMFGIK
jgi:tRNA U34 5-methylaminomethyl-2-thiouridine-forming methyltransferase MnmC